MFLSNFTYKKVPFLLISVIIFINDTIETRDEFMIIIKYSNKQLIQLN